MMPNESHEKSRRIRVFRPTSREAGAFPMATAFFDAALLALGFFLAVSPFVVQPGLNLQLPTAPFSGGERFDGMVLSVVRGGWFYFDDERLDSARIGPALAASAKAHPGRTLIIEADRRVPFERVVEAWNCALEAGISEVCLATDIAVTEPLPKPTP